ncbi:methionine ABC transporter permease [Bryobacter aggregatus]|uniref:methionine ABC transporter permease n=1 Tax=Bryobacter aggregatus TaxID=360054 RepID=UPI0004E14389|nr:methionine ABC transporter permease [Bryobacter aggregatus]
MSESLLPLLSKATLETLVIVAVALPLAGLGGLLLGVLLVLSAPGGLLPQPLLRNLLGGIINFGRSVPFIILMVALVPVTRWLVGTSIGTAAAIVPLVFGAIPYGARLVEAALLEIDPGVRQAVEVMGARPWQIVTKVYLPEALPSLIRAATLLAVTLINYSAMAGAVGGGGLGDLAIRYGYQRFRPDVMLSTVLVLVALVQGLQWAGDRLSAHADRR